MKISSVRFRLLLWNTGLLALALLGSQYLAQTVIRTSLQADMDKRLKRMANGITAFIVHPLPETLPPPPPPRNRHTRRYRDDARMRRMIRVFDLQGAPLLPPGPGQTGTQTETQKTPWDRAAFTQAVHGQVVYTITRDSDGMLVRVLSRPIARNGKHIGVLQVATSYEEMQTLLSALTRMSFFFIPCVLLVAAIVGVILTDRALRPVRDIVRAAERLNPDDLSQRLPVVGTDEFAHLATTMNGMLARIETAFAGLRQSLERERRFTADASHEIRTPLTAITANATLALDDDTLDEYRHSMQAVKKGAANLQHLIEDLLLLARSDSGQITPVYDEIETAALFTETLGLVRREADQAAIHTEIAADAPRLRGDANQLHRVLLNLLRNALNHTPADGQIRLSAHREHGQLVLRVADTGEGIAPEHLPHLCERFYRVEKSRTRARGGTGLGLAICKSIVDAHHGALRIDSTPGQGTVVTVTLPERPAAPSAPA